MNKRIQKKRKLLDLVAELQRANDLQQEVIEDYGYQLAEAKRELAELRAIVERNAQATNIRCDYLESKNSALSVSLDQAILEFKKTKKPLFGRK